MDKIKDFHIVEEKETFARKVSLRKVDDLPASLEVQYVTTTFWVKYQLHQNSGTPAKVLKKMRLDETIQNTSYPLVEISTQQLAELRVSGIPSFLLKKENRFFHAEIPEDLNLVDHEIIGPHRCAMSGRVCDRLSAANDEKGGCALVREFSRNIEKCPWISYGFETFGTKTEVTSVAACEHYLSSPMNSMDCEAIREKERNVTNFGFPKMLSTSVDGIKIQSYSYRTLSLQTDVSPEDGAVLGDFIPSTALTPEEMLVAAFAKEDLKILFSNADLKKIEKTVIEMCFGLEGHELTGLKSVAKKLKKSRSEVEKIASKALRKLRLTARKFNIFY